MSDDWAKEILFQFSSYKTWFTPFYEILLKKNMIENKTAIFERFRREKHKKPKSYIVNIEEDIFKIWQLYERKEYKRLCNIVVDGDSKIILQNMKKKIKTILEKRTIQKYNLIRHMAKQEMIKNLERIYLEYENDEIFFNQILKLYRSF